MNYVSPAPIIVMHKSEPDKCPSCGKDEKKIEVCAHCKYEYKEEKCPYTGADVFLFFLILGLIIYAICTIWAWIFTINIDTGQHQTLIGVLQFQGQIIYDGFINKIISSRIW